MKLRKSKTARGFTIFNFVDVYHWPCSLQESSSVEPQVWLGKDEHTRMLLTPSMAWTIGWQLIKFAIRRKL